MKWEVGDGRRILFWNDAWLQDAPLYQQVLADIPSGMQIREVQDY